MKKTVQEIARVVKGEVLGDSSIVITGISGIKEAKEGELTFLANPKYSNLLNTTKASCVITSKDTKTDARVTLIQTDNPDLAFARMVELIAPRKLTLSKGINKLASVSKNARIGKDVSIGAFTVVEDSAEIGDNSVLYSGVYIGHEVKMGKNTLVYPHVSVRERCQIGNNVIIHSGTVVGSDGFGYAQEGGVIHKVPQIGTVVIEDDVEIGANVTIDRARFGKTIIGKSTKIDNLVQIAHNVVIGEKSMIIAQAGISGSSRLGKGVVIAGQVGIVGHVEIGDGTVIAAQSGVSKSIGANMIVGGAPVKPLSAWKRITACIQRLPELFKTVGELKNKIKALEERLDGKTEDCKK